MYGLWMGWRLSIEFEWSEYMTWRDSWFGPIVLETE